jgi:hypothetical protein
MNGKMIGVCGLGAVLGVFYSCFINIPEGLEPIAKTFKAFIFITGLVFIGLAIASIYEGIKENKKILIRRE